MKEGTGSPGGRVIELLKPREKPNPRALINALKDSLQAAIGQDIFSRMEHNHNARFCRWDGHDETCRKPDARKDLEPGTTPNDIFPWPGAADHEARIVDDVIGEHTDLLMVAAQSANISIAPGRLDLSIEKRQLLAEKFGALHEYYREETEYQRDNALSQVVDCGWEYGHGIGFVGWTEEYQTDRRTVSAADILQMVTTLVAEQMLAEQPQPVPEEVQAAIAEAAVSEAAARLEQLLITKDAAELQQFAALLQQYDEEMEPDEALRVMADLKAGEDAVYYVPALVKSQPDYRALKPGINVFYPWDTTRIQESEFVVMTDWWSASELRAKAAKVRGDEAWNAKVVKTVIDQGPQASCMAMVDKLPPWVLSGGVIGQGLKEDVNLNGDGRKYQVLTFYYRATGKGGIPTLFTTVVSPSAPEEPLYHVAAEEAHGEYPLWDYVRERRAECLWDSRGVGELTFSEQEELRIQLNFRSDNAALMIAPPLEIASIKANKQLLKPRARFHVLRAGESSIRKVDIGGSAEESLMVDSSVQERVDAYWKRGKNVDPVVRQNRWKRLVNDWLGAVKRMERMAFKLIQQYSDERIEVGALGGLAVDLQLTRADIRGGFSLQVDFDAANLDPDTVQARLKMLREYVAQLNAEGLLSNPALMRLMVMMINPTWVKMLIKDARQSAEEEQQDIADILTAAVAGIEKPYVSGKNHRARAQMILQALQRPAMGENGKPIVDESTGQPLPGRIARIMREDPEVAALIMNRLKFEQRQAEQFDNADTGRRQVEVIQKQDTP